MNNQMNNCYCDPMRPHLGCEIHPPSPIISNRPKSEMIETRESQITLKNQLSDEQLALLNKHNDKINPDENYQVLYWKLDQPREVYCERVQFVKFDVDILNVISPEDPAKVWEPCSYGKSKIFWSYVRLKTSSYSRPQSFELKANHPSEMSIALGNRLKAYNMNAVLLPEIVIKPDVLQDCYWRTLHWLALAEGN